MDTYILCDDIVPYLGVLVLFLAFFAFLHCWLNAFAEMLRFGDRMFYKVTDSTNRKCFNPQIYTLIP